VMVSRKAKDMPTDHLGGASPRRLMEAMSSAVENAAPKAISEIMRRRITPHLQRGRSVVVDGIRSPTQAQTVKNMGGFVVRVDNGRRPDPQKPMDQRAATIKADYTLDTSGKKADRKAACDKMLGDLREPNT
jgi:hypothetical protein